MSQFNVHEWNYKRRLAEIEDRLFTGQSPERQEQALEDLANAIEELEMSGVFDDGNKMVEFMLNKEYNMLSKKANMDSDLNEIAGPVVFSLMLLSLAVTIIYFLST